MGRELPEPVTGRMKLEQRGFPDPNGIFLFVTDLGLDEGK